MASCGTLFKLHLILTLMVKPFPQISFLLAPINDNVKRWPLLLHRCPKNRDIPETPATTQKIQIVLIEAHRSDHAPPSKTTTRAAVNVGGYDPVRRNQISQQLLQELSERSADDATSIYQRFKLMIHLHNITPQRSPGKNVFTQGITRGGPHLGALLTVRNSSSF